MEGTQPSKRSKVLLGFMFAGRGLEDQVALPFSKLLVGNGNWPGFSFFKVAGSYQVPLWPELNSSPSAFFMGWLAAFPFEVFC